MKIAMIGTRGVPAAYGGFETAVDEVGTRLVERGHDVTVYCRGPKRMGEHKGIHCIMLPAPPIKSLETLAHTALSILHARRQPFDAVVLFNAGNAPLLALVNHPVVLHVDGLEWRRGKWGRIGRAYYQICERVAAGSGHDLIADAEGIATYYEARYNVRANVIAYGAPVRLQAADDTLVLGSLDLDPDGYLLVVARLEPENNVHLVVDAYERSSRRMPLVVVGDAPYRSRYLDDLRRSLAGTSNVRHLGRVDDQQLLDVLYANAHTYVHGHTVGGTNPSLLRAMGAGAPVIVFDCVFSREVCGDVALYFSNAAELCLKLDESMGTTSRERGAAARRRVVERYDWDVVTAKYEALLFRCTDRNAT
jgi:glycosyltransferase involved in cell wall biosynthesis